MVLITNIATTTTYFVGAYYEVANGVVSKYYFAGSQRIAMRDNSTLLFLVGDHLGSTSLTTDANGVVVSELRYKAWGEVRHESGTNPTKYTYTGQYSYTADFGLMFYNARWVDVTLGRFVQADSIVPGGVQGLDRYAYVNNSPVQYSDPSGHKPCDEELGCSSSGSSSNSGISTSTPISPENAIKKFLSGYGITVSGKWLLHDLRSLALGVWNIANGLLNDYDAKLAPHGCLDCQLYTAEELFYGVFGPVNFEHVSYKCEEGCWGRSLGISRSGVNQIRIYGPSYNKLDQRLVVHELGHAFNAAIEKASSKTPYNDLDRIWSTFPKRSDPEDNGYFGSLYGWQQSPEETPGEEFADMFVGWTYNKWKNSPNGSIRADFMNENMPLWINLVIP